jgi:hypothetical protein
VDYLDAKSEEEICGNDFIDDRKMISAMKMAAFWPGAFLLSSKNKWLFNAINSRFEIMNKQSIFF